MRILFFTGVILSALPYGQAADFEADVAPLLIRRCLECHRDENRSGGLSLESKSALQKGGDSGDVIDATQPEKSYVLQRVISKEMPPPAKGVSQALSAPEQKILTDWVTDGAHWPADRVLDLYEVTTDVRGGRDWWAFQPVRRPSVPQVDTAAVVNNPIDAFVSARLSTRGMKPAPPSEARSLVRRMFYDVIGLPPSLEELATWSARIAPPDAAAANAALSQKGIEELTSHLLDSPHFGERWARYWLDLVRYAETSGYERDQPKPFAWKYRDWVVDAINSDMPYDKFIRHQLAGDEIPERTVDSVIGTGFLRLGTWNDEPNDDADYQYERLEDMVHTTSSAFLALTVKCARCHDHKFDPIPQNDYYRMASVFWPGPIAGRDRKLLGGPSTEELGFENVLAWTDLTPAPPPLHRLKNGERDKPLNVVKPATLTFAPHLYRSFKTNSNGTTTERRRQLANWIASSDNPLTARVFVNRLWQHHFGEGLVRSPNNFGYKGEQPTHPLLLDWLASEFISNGWSAKHIHKLILTSRTWQQSSLHPQADEYHERDSANTLWWRANRRRLDAEALRDALLAASGELNRRIGGPGFKPTISGEALEGFSRKSAVWQAAPAEEQRRRSLYVFVSRSLMPPMMTTFDQCDTTLPCAQRDVTTVAPQALALLNNEFTHARSDALATRVATVAATSALQVQTAWQFVLGRNPTSDEQQLALQHIASQTQRFETAAADAADAGDRATGSKPSNLPKPVLHLAADSGVTKDGNGRVSAWLSGTARHDAFQTNAAAQPLYVPNVINGQPVLRFNGAGQFLRLQGELLQSEYCTIMAVASDRAKQPRLREIISNWHRTKNVGTSVFLGLRDTNTVRFSDHFSSAGEIHDRGQPFVLSTVNAPDGVSIWQNTSRIAFRAAAVSGRRLGTEWVIGQQGNIDGEYWDGDIAEILVFDRPLTEEQLRQVWQPLLARYNLSASDQTPSEPAANQSPEHRALASLCHVLFNSNEFLYVD